MSLYFVTALKAEAAALIDHYRLKARTPKGLFPVYESNTEAHACALVVSGIGKPAAAAATAYLHSLMGEPRDAVWVNVGIAGHHTREVGELVIANKVTDAATQRSWYPPQVLKHTLSTEALITVDRPETDYPKPVMYDMEAAGFYSIASKCSSMEFVQSCKIISDNQQSPADDINRDYVKRLLENNINILADFVKRLEQYATEWRRINAMPEAYDHFVQQWHFTVTQQNILKTQLRRWQVLLPDQVCDISAYKSCRNASEVLSSLGDMLDKRPVKFGM